MPTISEPLRVPSPAPPLRPAEHLKAIMADLAELGIRSTRLGVLARALDVGIPEAIAVQLRDMIEAPRCAA
jgi:hypothetical protein